MMMMMMMMMRILLMTLGGLSAVSAARPQPGNTNHALAPLEPVTVNGGVAEHEQQQLETSETTPSSSSSSSSTRLEAPRGLSATTPACTKAYDILNNDKGYLDAIGAVFEDARSVGKQAGEKCWNKMKPSVAPLGGKCTASAQPFWTPERRADLVALSRASNAVLPPDEHAGLVWLDEDVVTGSPLPFIPCLGLSLKLYMILPVYVPASCQNDADMAEVLAYLGAGCMKEQPTLKSCAFKRAYSTDL